MTSVRLWSNGRNGRVFAYSHHIRKGSRRFTLANMRGVPSLDSHLLIRSPAALRRAAAARWVTQTLDSRARRHASVSGSARHSGPVRAPAAARGASYYSYFSVM